MGTFMSYNFAGMNSGWQHYLWVCIVLDVWQPLKRSKKIIINENQTLVVQCKYECLLIFCFVCRKLGLFDFSEMLVL